MGIELLISVCILNFNPQACETQKLINYARASAISVNIDSDDFIMLMSCESRIEKNAKGDFRSETGEYMAKNVFQWWSSSFNYYSHFYNLTLDRNNPYDQITLASLVIRDDGENNWKNCVKTHKLFSYKEKKFAVK